MYIWLSFHIHKSYCAAFDLFLCLCTPHVVGALCFWLSFTSDSGMNFHWGTIAQRVCRTEFRQWSPGRGLGTVPQKLKQFVAQSKFENFAQFKSLVLTSMLYIGGYMTFWAPPLSVTPSINGVCLVERFKWKLPQIIIMWVKRSQKVFKVGDQTFMTAL